MKGKGAIVGVLVLALAFVVAARLAMADGVRHFSLLARTMQPVDSSIGYDTSDGYLRTVQGSTRNETTAYVGQVDLPDGATIVGVRAFGLDSDPFFEFTFRLMRYNLDDDPVGSAVTGQVPSGAYFQDGKIELDAPVDPDAATVDNDEYSYGIVLLLPAPYSPPSQDLAVLRFVVDTSYNTRLPLVQRNSAGE
jgi:hypothetical protein